MPSIGRNLQHFTGNGNKNSWVGGTNKQVAHGPYRSPEKPTHLSEAIIISLCWTREEKNQYLLFLGVGLHLNKLQSPLPKDALCQVYLKLALWLWKRRRKYEKFTCQMDRQTDRWRMTGDQKSSLELLSQVSYNVLSSISFSSNYQFGNKSIFPQKIGGKIGYFLHKYQWICA